MLILSDARLRELMDLRVFVDTAIDICLIRRLKRDTAERGRTVDAVLRQYEDTVRPMYLQFVEPSKHYADILISGEGKDAEAADIVMARIKALPPDSDR
ncbi:MAG: nucleoside/nucleotide kinase family protein [Planctomycetota bacterium]|jgi:uridine kinase